MAKFRSKPIVIEAVQVSWSNWSEVCDMVDRAGATIEGRHMRNPEEAPDTCGETAPFIEFDVTTAHGETAIVRHGDWLIPDSKPGTFYPCKPDVFARKYEPIDETAEVARFEVAP
jgi:hypothetical protein